MSDATRVDLLHERLADFPPSLFQFYPRMRDGWYSDRYLVRTAHALVHADRGPTVTVQVFAKERGILCGAFETVRLLETQLAPDPRTGRPHGLADLTVATLMDGDLVEPWEPVMHVTGPYLAFAHLETDYLGVLARRTLIASNVRRVIDAAAGRPVIFMGARHDDWRVQTPDGYAAMVGGAGSVSSDAGGAWWGARGVGTMPHALVAAFGGDTVAATLAFTRYVRDREPGVSVTSLVDYHDDVVTDALAVARAMHREFGDGVLSGVRVDTSEKLVDRSLQGVTPDDGETLAGVSPRLVRTLRTALDAEGFDDVGVIVSGGFTPRRIRRFEEQGVPVAGYGVGSSLLGHNKGERDGLLNNFDFTADIVLVDGKPESKTGRELRTSDRLVAVDVLRLADFDRERREREG